MRGIILVLILLVVLAIGAIATGFINFNTAQPAEAPAVVAKDGELRVEGGQPPKIQVETGKLAVGTGEATLKIPRLEVRPADGAQPQAAQPQPQSRPAPTRPAQGGVADTNATQQ